MNISDIISKPLIIPQNGLTLNFSGKMVVDNTFKKIKHLIYLLNNEKFYLEPKKIFAIGDKAIIVKKLSSFKKESDVNLLTNQYYINLNSNIYTNMGDFVAKLTDIDINEDYSINNLVLTDMQKEITKITSSGDNFIVVNSKNASIQKIDHPAKIKKEEYKHLSVKTLIIPRQTSNTNFLQGRIVTKDIIGYSGELIIKKNSIINEKIILEAKKNFKIQELIYNSKEIISM